MFYKNFLCVRDEVYSRFVARRRISRRDIYCEIVLLCLLDGFEVLLKLFLVVIKLLLLYCVC